ncbi:DUF4270 domain-containing protein [Cruoricaptor ignavus]|uniref:DUF4270 domain-containing protein n=1 Tax=Cruoricaptor ignavus TaxID=1118202 RepID=UPI00370D953D
MTNFKLILKTSIAIIGSFLLFSCEPELDSLGSQLVKDNVIPGNVVSYDVVAYNVNNGDIIRTDGSKLTAATIGAFHESQFGLQKSSFITQIRPSAYAPDFGKTPVVDSVVLVLKPYFASDSLTTSTDENFQWNGTAAKKTVSRYPITKYGKAKKNMTLQVHEVKDFLGSASDTIYSNRQVNTGVMLGTKNLDGSVSAVKIVKKDDNSELLSRDAGIRISLDKNFFQDRIISKAKSPEMADASNFVRYFGGLRISVAEDDGYIFTMAPGGMELIMYYHHDADANGSSTAQQGTFSFIFGGANARFNQIWYDRKGSALANWASDENMGDKKLYAQGMGGPGFGIRIPQSVVAQIKQLGASQDLAVLSAKLRLYSDVSTWNNTFAKPVSFVISPKGKTSFISDMTAFAANPVFSLITTSSLKENPAYYDISITQTLKDIIEKDAENTDLILNVGYYEVNASNIKLGAEHTSTAYTPNRIVLVGSDAGNDKRARLQIIYTKR